MNISGSFQAFKKWSLRILAVLGVVYLASYTLGFVSGFTTQQCLSPARKPQEREKACTRALYFTWLNPGHEAAIYESLGYAYGGLEKEEQALNSFDKALQLAPGAWGLYITKGRIYESLRDYERAGDSYTMAITPNSDFLARLYWMRANNLDATQQYDEALEDYNKAILLSTDRKQLADFYTDRAIFFMRDPETWGKSIADYSEAIERSEFLKLNPARAYMGRGQMRYLTGEYNLAVADFLKAIETNNELRELSYLLIWTYLADKGAGNDANANLKERVTKHNPTEWPFPIVQVFLGQINLKDIQTPSVHPGWSELTEETAARCEISFYMGQLALLRKDKAEAKKLFIDAINTRMIDYTEYRFAQSELNRLEAESSAAAASQPPQQHDRKISQ